MSGQALAAQAAAVILGVAALHVFFSSIEVKWPRTYFSLHDVAAQRVAASPWRYVAFRALPVFVVAFFVSGSLARWDLSAAWPAIAIGIVHAVLTNGRAASDLVKRPRAFGRWPLLVGHAGAAVSSVAIAAFAVVAARIDGSLVLIPSAADLSVTLWTGIVAAILGVYVVQMANRPIHDSGETMAKSRRSISNRLWSVAEQAAAANAVDPKLVKAILLVENLQRPRWIRMVENLKARMGLAGTYGIMQVRANGPLTDEQSIWSACTGHLKNTVALTADYEGFGLVVRQHNPDPSYVDLVRAFFYGME